MIRMITLAFFSALFWSVTTLSTGFAQTTKAPDTHNPAPIAEESPRKPGEQLGDRLGKTDGVIKPANEPYGRRDAEVPAPETKPKTPEANEATKPVPK